MRIFSAAVDKSRHSEQIAALEKSVEDLRRDSKVIRLEWEDVYDRITRTMSRLNARIRKAEATEGPELEEQPPAEGLPSPGAVIGTHGILSQARMKLKRGR